MARPSLIDKVIAHDDEGHPVTVADRIVNGLRAGSYFEPAVAAAGIAKTTAYGWLRIAGKIRLENNGVDPDELLFLSDNERRCCRFLHAVEEAEGIYEIGALTTLERLARGGLTVKTVTTKRDAHGATIEVTEKIETLAPNAQVLEWRLSRRFPERYATRVEFSGGIDVGLDTDDRANALAESLTAYLAGLEDAQTPDAKAQPRTRAKRGNGS